MILKKSDAANNNFVNLTMTIVRLETELDETRKRAFFYSIGFWLSVFLSGILGLMIFLG